MVMKKNKEQLKWNVWCHCPSESNEDITRFNEKLKESPNGVPLHYPRFTQAKYDLSFFFVLHKIQKFLPQLRCSVIYFSFKSDCTPCELFTIQ